MDYEYKKFVKGKKIPEDSLLSLIYKQDGIPKTYEELVEEKQKLIEQYKGQMTKRKTSTTDYSLQEVSIEKQIDEIYRLIVVSDPILIIQENLYKYNNISNKLIGKTLISKTKNLLENVPQIIEIYWDDITNILSKELTSGNVELVSELINDLHNEKLNEFIKTTIKKTSISHKKADSSNDGMFMEEEFGKEVPGESNYHPKISNENVENLKTKHEMEELAKMREHAINMAEEQKRKELDQQIEAEEEEDLGMSR